MTTKHLKHRDATKMTQTPQIDTRSRVAAQLEAITDATKSFFDHMPVGEKIARKDLIDRVAKFVDLPNSIVSPIVTAFLRQYHDVTIMSGRHAGIYKGSLPQKATRPRCQHCGRPMPVKSESGAKVENNAPSAAHA